MDLQLNDQQPIFLQVASAIEDAILSGAFKEEEQIPSITDFSVNYKINPATALKGVNLLVNAGIVYKKRGLGMFVAQGATERLRNLRQEQFYEGFILPMLEEAARLGLAQEQLRTLIERGLKK